MSWQDEPMFNADGITLGWMGKKWIMLIVDGQELAMPAENLAEFKAHLHAFIDKYPKKEAA